MNNGEHRRLTFPLLPTKPKRQGEDKAREFQRVLRWEIKPIKFRISEFIDRTVRSVGAMVLHKKWVSFVSTESSPVAAVISLRFSFLSSSSPSPSSTNTALSLSARTARSGLTGMGREKGSSEAAGGTNWQERGRRAHGLTQPALPLLLLWLTLACWPRAVLSLTVGDTYMPSPLWRNGYTNFTTFSAPLRFAPTSPCLPFPAGPADDQAPPHRNNNTNIFGSSSSSSSSPSSPSSSSSSSSLPLLHPSVRIETNAINPIKKPTEARSHSNHAGPAGQGRHVLLAEWHPGQCKLYHMARNCMAAPDCLALIIYINSELYDTKHPGLYVGQMQWGENGTGLDRALFELGGDDAAALRMMGSEQSESLIVTLSPDDANVWTDTFTSAVWQGTFRLAIPLFNLVLAFFSFWFLFERYHMSANKIPESRSYALGPVLSSNVLLAQVAVCLERTAFFLLTGLYGGVPLPVSTHATLLRLPAVCEWSYTLVIGLAWYVAQQKGRPIIFRHARCVDFLTRTRLILLFIVTTLGCLQIFVILKGRPVNIYLLVALCATQLSVQLALIVFWFYQTGLLCLQLRRAHLNTSVHISIPISDYLPTRAHLNTNQRLLTLRCEARKLPLQGIGLLANLMGHVLTYLSPYTNHWAYTPKGYLLVHALLEVGSLVTNLGVMLLLQPRVSMRAVQGSRHDALKERLLAAYKRSYEYDQRNDTQVSEPSQQSEPTIETELVVEGEPGGRRPAQSSILKAGGVGEISSQFSFKKVRFSLPPSYTANLTRADEEEFGSAVREDDADSTTGPPHLYTSGL
eukprot:g34481.t1